MSKFASDSVVMLNYFVYIPPLDYHGRFEKGVAIYASVGNRIVIQIKVATSSYCGSAIKNDRTSFWLRIVVKFILPFYICHTEESSYMLIVVVKAFRSKVIIVLQF